METEKSKLDSPRKSKNNSSDIIENGDGVIEPVKSKKKSLRSKQKTQINGKEIENSTNEDLKVEESAQEQTELNNVKENGVNMENGDSTAENDKNNDENIDICGNRSEQNGTDNHDIQNEEFHENDKNETEDAELRISEENGFSATLNETESSAKNDNSVTGNDFVESEVNDENDEKTNGEANGTSESIQESDAEISLNGVNGSDSGSNYEDAHTTQKEQNDVLQDAAAKEESFFSNKISTFLGKWNSSPQKQDSEISSSKKLDYLSSDDRILNHPYLSKVTGRRGIKDRLNSSMSSLDSKNEEIKTPKNTVSPLDDSFRVRTNPPRLNPVDIEQNPPLRKFKGKRCLNANDEPEEEEEEEDDLYLAMTKRRKLNDKSQESGLLGSILTPFKKKSTDCENLKMSNPESKLSRFLSPFWFWKKSEGQKGK